MYERILSMWTIRVRQDARDGNHQLPFEDSGLTIRGLPRPSVARQVEVDSDR
jgi:hypothetical protein